MTYIDNNNTLLPFLLLKCASFIKQYLKLLMVQYVDLVLMGSKDL